MLGIFRALTAGSPKDRISTANPFDLKCAKHEVSSGTLE